MSDDNGSSNFDKIRTNLNSRTDSSFSRLNPETKTKTTGWTPLSLGHENASSSSSYSSVKKLNLFKRPTDWSFTDSSSAKRFRINTDTYSSVDSHQNEPLSLKRSSSRFSVVTPSTPTSPGPDSKFLPPFGRLSGRDSPSTILNNLNLSCDNIHAKNRSYFYSGKTTYGGANLRKSIAHRFGSTPYSRVPPIRDKSQAAVNQTNVTSKLREDFHLGSVTQRILDRLEKAAIPIPDAKSRVSSLISKTNTRLYDTPNPDIENKGRCRIDTTHKPVKYVLKASTEDQTNRDQTVDKSLDKDLEKLNQIKKAEKELEQQQKQVVAQAPEAKSSTSSSDIISRKDMTSGKITLRDVKKGRKIEEVQEPDDHLISLSNVQPLTFNSTLKPFISTTQSQKQSSEKTTNTISDKTFDTCDNSSFKKYNSSESLFKFSSPKLVASLSPRASPTVDVKFSSPISVSTPDFKSPTKSNAPQIGTQPLFGGSLFKFNNNDCITDSSKPKFESNELSKSMPSLFDQFKTKKKSNDIWSCPTCCTENEINVDKCVACEEINPNGKRSTESLKPETSFKFGSTNFAASQPSLNQLFKKDTCKNWTCETCSVSNDINENVCVSCETPNPKKPNQNETKPKVSFGFGSVKTSDNKSSLSELFKKDQTKKWTCSTCMVPNDFDAPKCVSCEEPNPNNSKAQNLSEVRNNFGFKFGSFGNNPTNEKKDIIEKSTSGWQCFYCKAYNQDQGKNICQECQKIKVVAATKEQVHKLYESQTFKFGSMQNLKPTSIDVPKSDTVKTGEVETSAPSSVHQKESSQEIGSLRKSPGESSFIGSKSITLDGDKTEKALDSNQKPFGNQISSKFDFPFKPPSSAFQFGSSNTSAFIPSDSKSISDKTASSKSDSKNESTTNAPNLFNVGSKISQSSLVSPLSASVTTEQQLAVSVPQNSDSTLKSILDRKPDVSQASSETKLSGSSVTTGDVQSSSLFTFGSKSTSSGLGTFNNKASTFSFNQAGSDSSKVSSVPNFSIPKTEDTPKATTSAGTSLETSFSKEPTTTPLFPFGGLPTITTSTASLSTATSNSSTFQKPFSFGSPLNVPKIDVGQPSQTNPKININFPQQPSASTTSNSSSIFEFGSVNNKPATKTGSEIKFEFNPSTNVSLNPNPTVGLVPSSFNFGTSNETGSNSLFSFGAKPSSTGFNVPPPTNTLGFGTTGIGMAQPPQTAFNPVLPSGINAPPQPTGNFSFGGGDQNVTPSNVFDGQEPGGYFQFTSNNSNYSKTAQRPVKKARRRYPPTK